MANHRSRKLLDLAHAVQECTNCGRWSEHGCEPAHENGIAAGKGMSIKSNDHRHAALCHDCHTAYDSGPMSREDKAEMFNRAYKRTQDIYWSQGWIKCA